MLAWLQDRFELSRGGKAHNLRVMEGLRGFAVFLVFLVHYVTLSAPWANTTSILHSVFQVVHAVGNLGVDLFFVLSGYLIYGSLIEREQSFLRFMRRRYQRIYPVFLVVLSIYLCLSILISAESKIPNGMGDAFLYIVANVLLLPGIFAIDPIITVAWSLSYEMLFYFLTPPLILLFGLRGRNPKTRIAIFILCAVVLLAFCLLWGGPVRLMTFLLGMILFEVSRHKLFAPPSGAIALSALLIAFASTTISIGGGLGMSVKMVVLFATFGVFFLNCFEAPQAWLARKFSWTPLRWLGNMSYSYYLFHGLALKAAFLLLGRVLPATNDQDLMVVLILPAMFAFTLIPTTLLFLMIERPFSLAPKAPAIPVPDLQRSN